jgi:hypothetical protein
MNKRIQMALDGELGTETLSEHEAAELRRAQAVLGSAVNALPSSLPDDIWPLVRQRIRDRQGAAPAPAEGDPARQKQRRPSLLSWLWTPRPISFALRPAYAVAAAGILAAAVAVADWSAHPSQVQPSTPHQVLVQFRLEAPHANQVALAGDFSEWQPAHTMRRSETGVWTVVVPLQPGIHDYAFVVDGERWVPDPLAPPVADGFGGVNSRLAVLTPDALGSL